MARSITHLIRMGTHAERDYLLRGTTWFDNLVLNANLVEATKAALGVFVMTLQKPYFIDPVTYAFALDPRLLQPARPSAAGGSRVRATFSALAAAYGLPALDQLGVRPITPQDFGEVGAVEAFTLGVVRYQQGVLAEALSANAEFVDASDAALDIARPTQVTPPYLVDEDDEAVRSLNVAFTRAAEREIGADAVRPMIAYDSRRVSPRDGPDQAVSQGFQSTECWLWPTDLDERFAAEQSLQSYADFVSALAQAGKRPIAAYGGFFALLLAFRGMSGIAHGVGYGDKRDLEPVAGGGLPPARYYFRPVRDGIAMGDLPIVAYGLSDDEFRERICFCTICSGLLAQGGVTNLVAEFNETQPRESPVRGVIEVPTSRVYRMARFHYLENRHREVTEVSRAETFEEIAGPLAAEAAWASGVFGRRSTSHIDRWIEAARPGRSAR